MSQTLSQKLDLHADFGPPDSALWRSLTEKVLNGATIEKKLVVKTPEGIAVQPIYGRDDLEAIALADTQPGAFPYLRGTRPEGYHSGTWEIRQNLAYPDTAEFNAAAKRDLSRGQDALVLQIDATGQHGTSIVSQSDFNAALEGIDLGRIAVHVEAGAAAPAAAEMLLARGQIPASGSVCFDPLALLATEGSLPMTMDRAWDLMAVHMKQLDAKAPGLKSLGVDVRWSGNAGGNAVTDLALMLASAAESLRALEARGLSPDFAAGKALVRFSVGTDFFMEIAKFRAARGLWAHFVKACGGGFEAAKLCQHAQTSIWEQTVLDPYVNLLRATSEAFSAVMGGVDGLTVDPFDTVAGLPNEFSRRIARNIQLVLRDEAHLTEVVDPAGGSWLVETLTDELAKKAWAKFQEIEQAGGLTEKLRDGSLRAEFQALAAERQLRLARRQDVKVGVNMYANLDEKDLEAHRPDAEDVAAAAAKRVAVLKAKRDETAVREALKTLSTGPLSPAPCEVLRLDATVEEVMTALGSGAHTRVIPVKLDRLTSGYERLRANMAAYVAENGDTPAVFLAQMGPVRQHKLRADFTAEFLKPSGFRILADGSYADAESAAAAVLASGAVATVICSTDDTYPELVPAFAKAVKAGNSNLQVLVAGLLPDFVEAFKAAGVDEFIHLRANNLQLLSDLQAFTGVAQ